jgi:hypothetical protein
LNDLAGVRVLVFPGSRLSQVDETLRSQAPFMAWTLDPVEDIGELTALTYYGLIGASNRIKAEYQIVSMLTGLFWEVEHSALYKPVPSLRGINRLDEMRQRYEEVLRALKAFDREFENSVRLSTHHK